MHGASITAACRRLLLGLLLASATGCGLWPWSEPAPLEQLKPAAPLEYGVLFNADARLNANRTSLQPAPLKLRLFHLRRQEEFLNGDFFSLQNEPATVLGDSLLGSEQFFLLPGQQGRAVRFEVPPGMRYLGVLGEFQDLQANTWRLVLSLPEPGVAPLAQLWPEAAGEGARTPRWDAQVFAGAGGLRLTPCAPEGADCR
ncbi:type VI secretion system protein VasD [Pseudomonas delhiensis]|uniref:Type VI secretion system protein VasD n=1 Tax=Pseudomonas delhiensis TaxID=366289 RepID=A0A239IA69_9PSED|nr:type VI secretion system lipoprotein TssJ [Pseudomonas delhiensis]SDK15931.1 type VI secretion system protein VasD [Pseudomonas delhiensis]SNS90475.1 type VI secretion system protein VasD [Pseudomonas delhiensis]